jgi:hypothetical protein
VSNNKKKEMKIKGHTAYNPRFGEILVNSKHLVLGG